MLFLLGFCATLASSLHLRPVAVLHDACKDAEASTLSRCFPGKYDRRTSKTWMAAGSMSVTGVLN